MSMINAQVERLGEIADFLESDPRTQATAPEVRRAADTIWELSCKLAGTVNQSEEIERLKAENASLKGAAQGLGELCDKYKAENDKLRKLCKDMFLFTSLTHAIVGEIHSREHGTWNADVFRERVRELGIEVDE